MKSLAFATLVVAILSTAPARAGIDRLYRDVRSHHAVRHDLTLSDLRRPGSRCSGQVVEWRGMVEDVILGRQGLGFNLKMGTDDAEIRVGKGSFDLEGGTAVGVLARVVQVGPHPVLELLAAAPAPEVGLGGAELLPPLALSALPASYGRLYPSWRRWMQSFNVTMSDQTATAYLDCIATAAHARGVDPRLVLSLVAAESAFNPHAVSPVGAMGLGQLMPGTASMLGIRDAYDANANLRGAISLLDQYLRRFGPSTTGVSKSLAAYNAGLGAVETYGGVPPYAETQNYVRYVLSLYRELGGVPTH